MQSDNSTATPATTQATECLTEGAIKNKIKFMTSELLNVGMKGTIYTTRMINDHHSFSQLNMTEHDKERLIMQCEEFYKVDLGLSCTTFKTLDDLIKKVIGLLSEQGRLATQAEAAGV